MLNTQPFDPSSQAVINNLNGSWESAWSQLVAKPNDALRLNVLSQYQRKERHYHTLQHLSECVQLLRRHCVLATNFAEVEIALWFHDAIYYPQLPQNELLSAQWAKNELLQAGVATEVANRVYNLVMATNHDAPPKTADEKLLVDIDLAILASSPERFDEYERQVRDEYTLIPLEEFCQKRREMLEHFLSRDHIYNALHFQQVAEANARKNLQRSIQSLSSQQSEIAKEPPASTAMQVFKRTTNELQREELDASNLVNLEVKIGSTIYTLSERDGALRVSVEGQLVSMPISFNQLLLSAR